MVQRVFGYTCPLFLPTMDDHAYILIPCLAFHYVLFALAVATDIAVFTVKATDDIPQLAHRH